MKLRINHEQCRNHAVCIAVAPEVVSLDDDGYAVPFDGELTGDLEAKAQDAVGYCPEQALSVGE